MPFPLFVDAPPSTLMHTIVPRRLGFFYSLVRPRYSRTMIALWSLAIAASVLAMWFLRRASRRLQIAAVVLILSIPVALTAWILTVGDRMPNDAQLISPVPASPR